MTTSLPVQVSQYTAETPLEGTALTQVFNTLRAYGPSRLNDAWHRDASDVTKDRLRLRLGEYEAQDADLSNVVLLVRRYFNTYRQNGWRIVEWQVLAALKLLATVAEAVEAKDAEQARKDELARARWARQAEAASHVQHGDPRCLTEATDGECVCC
jgi:hypothetical protein